MASMHGPLGGPESNTERSTVLTAPGGAPPPSLGEPSTLHLGAPASVDTPPTELRVHGVSGTPAEDMLDRHIIGQVAGDGGAGFFRPRTEYGATLGPGGARLEAYRWGNLTAGAAARAFWLLLLPFTLANLTMWLRPPATGFGRRTVHGLSRIFSITISATFTLAAIGLSMDLVAWQCAAPGSTCRSDNWWVASMFQGFFEPTGRRLALASVGPLLVVAVLWILARRTWARYEAFALPERNPDGDGLATPTFWDGRAQVSRLRGLHVAMMFAIIDAMLLAVLVPHDRNAEDAYAGVDLRGFTASTVAASGQVLAVTCAGVIVLVLLLLLAPPVVDRVSRSKLAGAVVRLVRLIAMLLTVATLGYAMLPRATWDTHGPMPAYSSTVTILFAAQAGLLGLLMFVIVFQRHRCKGALFGGFSAPIVGSLGLGLAAALCAGASYRVADLLDSNAVPSPANFGAEPQSLQLQPPVSYQWAAFGFVIMVLVVLLTGLWVALVTKPLLRRRARYHTNEDFPGARSRDRARAAQIDDAIASARLTDHVARPAAVAWFLLGLAGLAATGLAVVGKGPVQLANSATGPATAISVITNIGTYLISLSALLLVLLGIQTYRNERVRRTVGVIWDLATFWPRASHPLAPPCYAERVVPELVHRATWLATQQNGVLLSAHSQGSVLAAATVLQLPPYARNGTALLTYGAPLCRLYERAFPNYFNERVLDQVAANVTGSTGQPRWVNLWRRTDPIGGAVGRGDRRLADPSRFDAPPEDRLPPAVRGHSGYQVTPEFGQAVDDLLGLLRLQ